MKQPENPLSRLQLRQLTRRSFVEVMVGGLGAVAALPLVSACGIGSSPGVTAAKGGTLRLGMGATVANLDPHSSTLGAAMPVYYALYDGLTAIDFPNGLSRLKPALATTWKPIGDSAWEFTLRQGVKFSNGETFDAQAVKFSIERVIDPKNPQVIAGRIPSVTGVEIVDPTTVRIHTKTATPLLPGELSVVWILPPKYMASVGAGFASKPIGSGAWTLKEFSINDHVTLEANPTSWRGRPTLDQVIIRVLPNDAARASALQSKELDLIEAVPTDIAVQLKSQGLKTSYGLLGRVQEFFLRAPGAQELQSKEVRLALNYAVDRDSIVKNVMDGFGRPESQMIGPDGLGHDPSLKPYPYDPQKAKQMLAAAGYPNGFTLKFQGTSGLYVNDTLFQQAVMGYLSKVGVTLEYQQVEASQYVQTFLSGKEAPVFHAALNYFPVQDADFAWQWLESTSPTKLYSNKEFDQLFAQSRVTVDVNERKALLLKIAQLLYADPPAIMLFQPPDVFAASAKVIGFIPRPDLVIWFDQISLAA